MYCVPWPPAARSIPRYFQLIAGNAIWYIKTQTALENYHTWIVATWLWIIELYIFYSCTFIRKYIHMHVCICVCIYVSDIYDKYLIRDCNMFTGSSSLIRWSSHLKKNIQLLNWIITRNTLFKNILICL